MIDKTYIVLGFLIGMINKKSQTTIFIIVIVVVGLLFVGYKMMNSDDSGNGSGKKVKLETSKGDIVIEMYDDMPVTVGNFVGLVEKGFYDGVVFHRVIPGFMVQGGDTGGTGMGGPGYEIKDEFTHAGGNKNNRGTISMANSGPDSGGSQFFINVNDNNFLDSKHPVFGEVVEGMDVVDAIVNSATDGQDRPLEEIKMIKVSLV
jgi:peptidylprolyl isomerase